MKLELFQFIDDTIHLFEQNKSLYEYAESRLMGLLEKLFEGKKDSVVAMRSRIKNTSSLKEKLLRNQFYLDYENSAEALDHLSDLIGITVQCRFIRNEAEIYKFLFQTFDLSGGVFSRCRMDHNVFLNLRMPQPQLQRNGFTIYRIDGYIMINQEKINFELQIKSLVHTFWSEIEHEVVYKNPDFVMYDMFNRNMLGAIRDNLDVVDRQLEIMYNEISYESSHVQIGMDEKGFKEFVARSINELVNRKMKDSVGFVTDFKKCSAIIAQYIYVKDFANGEHNPERMIDYLQLLNYLSDIDVEFNEEIFLENPFTSNDPFCRTIGEYWISQMNLNFQWHIFFVMLFTIQPGNNLEDFVDFANIIKILLIQPSWYEERFSQFEPEVGVYLRKEFESILAEALCDADTIEIVHEDKLFQCMMRFRKFVERIEMEYHDYDALKENMEEVRNALYHQISTIFQ